VHDRDEPRTLKKEMMKGMALCRLPVSSKVKSTENYMALGARGVPRWSASTFDRQIRSD